LDTQNRNVFILLFVLLLISCEFIPLTLASESTFSVIWITDTQYLLQTYPSDFDNTCNWIISNKDTYNIKIVVHTGDIVNTASDLDQWENANHSMGMLLDNGIPYCWDAGNHDDQSAWNGLNFKALNARARVLCATPTPTLSWPLTPTWMSTANTINGRFIFRTRF